MAGAVQAPQRQADQDGTDTKLLEAQNSAKLGDADVLLKAAQTGKTTAETEVVKQQVAKTKAETKKTLHDAAAPHVKPGAAAARRRQRRRQRRRRQRRRRPRRRRPRCQWRRRRLLLQIGLQKVARGVNDGVMDA